MLGGGGTTPLVFLLRDEFTTTESAPMTSPRTCEPGPGTLTVTDPNAADVFITGGALEIDAAPSGARNIHHTDGFARAAGRAMVFTMTATALAVRGGWGAGVNDVGAKVCQTMMNTPSALGWFLYVGSGPFQSNDKAVSFATEYTFALVLRGSGSFVACKGGAYSDWTLVNADGELTTTPLYPILAGHNASGDAQFGYLRVLDLGGPWATDYGIATERLSGSRSAGDTFTHEVDCLVEWTQTTVPSSGATDVLFRYQDSDNFWAASVASDGSYELFEVVATSWTSRGSAAAATVSDGHRCVVIADDEEIKCYSNNTHRITYSSAANFKTETDGELDALGTGGVASDVIAWPRTLSGAAKSKLDEASA